MPLQYDWSKSPERLLGDVFAHRAARLGFRVVRTRTGARFPDELAPVAKGLGVEAHDDGSAEGRPLAAPRVALYAGAAIGYPYYAYYVHCLLSLGLSPALVDAADVAAGRLAEADLFVMPGGFATWGLDRAEDVAGVDSAVMAFLAGGGAYIGSCGGAFYLSEGRPHWLGLIDAKPKYTHEYLQTGAGVVNVRLTDPVLRGALPERLEMPYYHGPAYPPGERAAHTLADFADLAMPSRLFINNPLERDRFERDLAGAPAVLQAAPEAGRALVFSPHPEMGDFVRKGIALDAYVRKYLPIRGQKTMDETLRFYGGEDCLSFRLVDQAIGLLGLYEGRSRAAPMAEANAATALADILDDLQDAMGLALRGLERTLAGEDQAFAGLLGLELARRSEERDGAVALLKQDVQAPQGFDGTLARCLAGVLSDAAKALRTAPNAPFAQQLVSFELPARIIGAANRILRCDRALETIQ